jgi:hypothetical protein
MSSSGPPPPATSSPEAKPLLVRVGSEQHLIPPQPQSHPSLKGMTRIASESHLSSMVPVSPHSSTTTVRLGGGQMGAPAAPAGSGGAGFSAGMQQGGFNGMHRCHSVATLGVIDELQATTSFPGGHLNMSHSADLDLHHLNFGPR